MEIANNNPVCLAIIMFGLGLGLTIANFKELLQSPEILS